MQGKEEQQKEEGKGERTRRGEGGGTYRSPPEGSPGGPPEDRERSREAMAPHTLCYALVLPGLLKGPVSVL